MFTDKLTLAIAEAAKKCMEEGSLGYVAFGHDGKRHEVYANSSYEAKQKAVSHFKTPKSKQHLVSVTLAQKDGKDVVHTATESVQESKLDDILDARRAKEADGYTKTEKPVVTKKEVPGIRYGGKNQKPEKETEIEEGAVPSTEKTVTVKHKTSGKELVVTARSVPEYVKGGYHPIKESMSNPGLESFASKVRAELTGKASNPALEKIAHEKAKEKYLKKEEVEEIDEVSKGLLGRYITKASLKAAGHAYKARDTSSNDNKSGEHIDKTFKRLDGIKTAVSKLAKEEVEELDELDKKTLGSYVKKASLDVGARGLSNNNTLDAKHLNTLSKMSSRVKNINKAVDKLTKEEVEDTQDLNESKAHIEQHLADRDINSKVTGNVVKVHSSDVSATKKHIQNAGYKDHTVVGGLNEEKMSDEDMSQREKIVKGMKKNLQGFKTLYGDRAKDVMYATATKHAMKEGAVPSTEKTVTVKHHKSGKELVVTANSADKYKSLGYHPVKEEVEQLVEREESPTKGTRKVASYGNHEHTAEVRYNPEYQEYQVHHYKNGKHQGEGPVSYHYDDKADAHSTAKHSVGIKEDTSHVSESEESRDPTGQKIDNKTIAKMIATRKRIADAEARDKENAQKLNKEEVEQIDEISNKLKKDYREKAHVDLFKSANTTIGAVVKKDADKEKEFRAKWQKRIKGIGMVDKKLAREEVEQIDELSNEKLTSYVKGAEADKKDSVDRYNAHDRDDKGNKISDKDRSPARRAIDNMLSKRVDKRVAGIKTANAKLAREEVDSDTFNAELADNKAKAAGTKKQPDIAKASVQAVKQESFSDILSMIKEGVRPFLKGKNNG
jgi:hypothetical protein